GGTSSESSPQHKNGTAALQHAPSSVNSSAPSTPPVAASEPLTGPAAPKTSLEINTCAAAVCNSREINTSDIERLKVAQNQHLQKNTTGEAPTSALGAHCAFFPHKISQASRR